jgi:prevent-host-death family protein
MTMVIFMIKKIAAAQFKAECLQLMDDVKEKHVAFVITKHGVPVAKLVPFEEEPVNLYGALKGTVKIKGDIISPISEQWDAEE